MTNFLAACVATTGLLAAGLAGAAEQGPPATIKTVWLDGKGQSSMADKVNKLHADMAAKGWKFVDLAVYTEDGDMQGLFITYERDAAATARQ
jgi:hypothetical protein